MQTVIGFALLVLALVTADMIVILIALVFSGSYRKREKMGNTLAAMDIASLKTRLDTMTATVTKIGQRDDVQDKMLSDMHPNDQADENFMYLKTCLQEIEAAVQPFVDCIRPSKENPLGQFPWEEIRRAQRHADETIAKLCNDRNMWFTLNDHVKADKQRIDNLVTCCELLEARIGNAPVPNLAETVNGIVNLLHAKFPLMTRDEFMKVLVPPPATEGVDAKKGDA